MTRKDFEMIAATLAEVRADFAEHKLARAPGELAVDIVIKRFANALKSTNSRFNADRFIEACSKK